MSVNSSFQLYLIVFIANLLALTGDTIMTWSSPVLAKLHSNDTHVNPLSSGSITQQEESLIASLIYLGPFIGTLPLSYLANKVGRKPVLLTLGVLHIVSFVTLAFATNIKFFYFARILGGCATSACYLVLPMYIAEIAENQNRGKLVISFFIFSTFGSLLSYILGTYLSIMWMNLFLAGIGIIFVVAFAMHGLEIAHYYLLKNNKIGAKRVLVKLRGNDESKIKRECQIISIEIYKIHCESGSILNTLKQRHVIKASLIAVGLMISQQFSGIAAFTAYTEKIFSESDTIASISASTSSIIVGLVQFISVGMASFVIDKLGRKFLFLSSVVVAILAEVMLGAYFYLKENTDFNYHTISCMPILSIILFFISYSCGFGGITVVLYSEMFPSNVKFYITAIGIMLSAGSGFLVALFYSSVTESIGIAPTILIFAVSCVVTMVCFILYVPETKGMTFHEIHTVLE